MKTLLIVLIVSALIIPVTVSRAFADTIQVLKYNGVFIQRLSNATFDDFGFMNPKINSSGWVVWEQGSDTQSEIFLHNGTTAAKITNNTKIDGYAQINNNGLVTWVQCDESDCEIFLYNGMTGTTTRLTDNDYNDSYPQINNNNQVVWQGCDDSTCEIFLYDSGSTTQLTSGEFNSEFPQINDLGYVTWNGCVGEDCDTFLLFGQDWEVFLFDGTDTTRITTNEYADAYTQINNIGQVVWVAEVDADYEVMRYDHTTHETLRITDNDYFDLVVDMSNNGDIVWHQYEATSLEDPNGDFEIYLYDNDTQETTKLTDNETREGFPQINDSGAICWWSLIDSENSKVYRYVGGSAVEIPGDYIAVCPPMMNEAGHIVWAAIVPDQPVWGAASTLGTDSDNTFQRKVNLLTLIVPLGFALVWMRFRRSK